MKSIKYRQGKARIGRRSGQDGHTVTFELVDETSRVHLLEVEMSLTDFGNIVTGLESDCVYRITGDLSLAGKTREHKTEEIFVPTVEYKQQNRANQLVAQALKAW